MTASSHLDVLDESGGAAYMLHAECSYILQRFTNWRANKDRGGKKKLQNIVNHKFLLI